MGCTPQAFYSQDTKLTETRIQQLQPSSTGIYSKEVTLLLLNTQGKHSTSLASPFYSIRRFCRATTRFKLLLCFSLILVQMKSSELQRAALLEPQLEHSFSFWEF